MQHYKHKDALASYLMNLAGVIYWFNPLVWYALKEMLNDREVACDTSVLKMLDDNAYEDYGNTLINFAEKLSLTPFPFASSLGGSMTAFILTAVLLMGLTPFLSTYAADNRHYHWNASDKKITNINLSTYFTEYDGSFVLYDLKNDTWKIYDEERALLRVSPDSTYKIYDALFGLEEGVITPSNSFMAWNGETYPFELWNADQSVQQQLWLCI